LPAATLPMVSVLACHPWASSGVTSSGLDHAPLVSIHGPEPGVARYRWSSRTRACVPVTSRSASRWYSAPSGGGAAELDTAALPLPTDTASIVLPITTWNDRCNDVDVPEPICHARAFIKERSPASIPASHTAMETTPCDQFACTRSCARLAGCSAVGMYEVTILPGSHQTRRMRTYSSPVPVRAWPVPLTSRTEAWRVVGPPCTSG